MSLEGTHTLVYTALEDLRPMPPEEPGIKQLHMLFLGFKNPPAGRYPITVTMETGPNGALETETAQVDIRPTTYPKINVTNLLFDPKGLNSNYQQTSPGQATPRPFDLLLWDRDGKPFEGVTIKDGTLVHSQAVVGRITIEAPAGATGQSVTAPAPAVTIPSPVTGIPTAHIPVTFRAGSLPGTYTVTFQMEGGNALRMIVRVQ